MQTNLGKKRLLLLQDVLEPFRRPVFNGLAEHYDVTVVHSGQPSVHATDRFREAVHPARRLGPLSLRDHTSTTAEAYDVTVSMSDLRWPDCIFSPLRDQRTYRLPDHVTLDIVGDGTERAALEQRVRKMGMSSAVTFHGDVRDDERLAALFASAFACAVPGYVGLLVLHSFAYGVPVVTPRDEAHAPEFQNLEDGINGLICDKQDFAEALVQACTPPDRTAMLGRNAYAFYSNKRTLDMMLYGFRKAIEGW